MGYPIIHIPYPERPLMLGIWDGWAPVWDPLWGEEVSWLGVSTLTPSLSLPLIVAQSCSTSSSSSPRRDAGPLCDVRRC